jgi:RecA-family ATPase
MDKNTNTNTSQAAPKTFDIIDGNTLLEREYEPLQFAVEKILPHGLFILAGSGKIGKSWLSLDLCVNVATGGRLWDFSSERGGVLYLALEDGYPRLQDRLNKIRAASVNGPAQIAYAICKQTLCKVFQNL